MAVSEARPAGSDDRVLFPEQSRKGYPRARWSDEDILDAIRQWVRRYGEPPGVIDWNPSLARHRGTPQRAAAFLSGDYPHSVTVVQRFDGWVAALRAAGCEPRKPGPRTDVKSRADRLSRRNLQRLRSAKPSVARVGATDFAASVRAVAEAERSGEPELLQDALLTCAAVAVAWADRADR